jgi:hypothetical protein
VRGVGWWSRHIIITFRGVPRGTRISPSISPRFRRRSPTAASSLPGTLVISRVVPSPSSRPPLIEGECPARTLKKNGVCGNIGKLQRVAVIVDTYSRALTRVELGRPVRIIT